MNLTLYRSDNTVSTGIGFGVANVVDNPVVTNWDQSGEYGLFGTWQKGAGDKYHAYYWFINTVNSGTAVVNPDNTVTPRYVTLTKNGTNITYNVYSDSTRQTLLGVKPLPMMLLRAH